MFTKESNSITVVCSKEGLTINGTSISFPAHLNDFTTLFGEPSRKEKTLAWNAIWDDLGVFVDYGTWSNILGVGFLISNEHKKELSPKTFFTGQILVDGENVLHENFEPIDLNSNQLRQFRYKGFNTPYAVYVGQNFNNKEALPNDKYTIKPTEEETISFKDFGFKLSIVQELMYTKELLKPKFYVYDFTEVYDKRSIDIEEEGYDPIPEVVQYFKDLPIPKKLAKEITEIYQDGGNDIYLQLIPFAEGWEDYWDIESIEDLEHFPNLKNVELCYAKDGVFEALKAKGIDVKWV